MRPEQLPLADILANDPQISVVEDSRDVMGCIRIKCPNDDGSGQHVLTVCNPVLRDDLPAMIFCAHAACMDLDLEQFLKLLGCQTGQYH